MRTGSTKPEWDTPPNGDFAAYVEQLTASAAPAQAQARKPSSWTGVKGAQQAKASRQAATTGSPVPSASDVLPPDLLQLLAPLSSGLRLVRTIWLFFIIGHGIVLFLFAQGSMFGLVVMGLIWWGMGWLLDALPKMAGGPGAERARTSSAPRKTGNKK